MRWRLIIGLQGGGGSVQQPQRSRQWGNRQASRFRGIKECRLECPHAQTIASAEDGTRGYVLDACSRTKFGRPIAFIYPGEPPAPDGSMYHLEPDALRGSFNLHALSQGLAYATYYWGLFHDLRDELTTAVVAARAAGRGIYAEDVTTTGFEVAGMASLTDDFVIMPKLFRRLSEYINSTARGGGGGVRSASSKRWRRAESRCWNCPMPISPISTPS